MSLKNPMGDLELSDPRAMRALAHPVRLAILSELQRHGPATATQLAPDVGATPSVASWHLRHLASFGLVGDWDGGTDRRQRWWQAMAPGFRFEAPPEGTDPQGREAYRLLSAQLLRTGLAQVQAWLSDTEPQLPPVWQAVAGASNTTVPVTREEAEEVLRGIDEMLAPFVHRRESGTVPPGARDVRFLRYSLPEADDE